MAGFARRALTSILGLGLVVGAGAFPASASATAPTAASTAPLAADQGRDDPAPGETQRYRDPELRGRPTVHVRGRLLVNQEERTGRLSYAVARESGDLVPVEADFDRPPEPMVSFEGDLVVPDGLADEPPGEALVALDRTDSTLPVAEAALTTPEASPTRTTHRIHLAAPLNFGDLGASEDEALVLQASVDAYWERESNGRLDIVDPPSLRRYTSAQQPRGQCGLGVDFWSVAEEAARQFPDAEFVTGTDQLVVLVPAGCVSSNSGMGSVGAGLASPGYSVNAFVDYGREVITHEMGHNYGFRHAEIGPCDEDAEMPDCAVPYGDYYSAMGGPARGLPPVLGTASRWIAGVLDVGEVHRVPLDTTGVGRTDTVTVAPRAAGSGVRSIEVTDPATLRRYFVDFRAGLDNDAGTAYARSYSGAFHRYRPGVVVQRALGRWTVLAAVGNGETSLQPGQSWSPGASDVGPEVTVSVESTGPGGARVSVTQPSQPGLSSLRAPMVSGTPKVGSTLDLDVGSWDPEDAQTWVEWLVGGTVVAEGSGAPALSLLPEHVGKTVTARVTAFAPGRHATVVTSAATGPVAPGVITGASDPWISTSYPTVGDTVSGHHYFSGGVAGLTTSYQWYSGGASISGATGTTHVVANDEAGKPLQLRVTLTAPGYEELTVSSRETEPVGGGTIGTVGTPTISGTPRVGRALTALEGTWSPGVTFTYVWSAEGSPIWNATARRFTPTAAQLRLPLSVEVTGHLPGREDTSATSASSAPVVAGILVAPTPRVSGTAKVGRTLSASPGTWTAGTTLSYQWYAGSTAIYRATRPKLYLTSRQAGKRIRVRVIGRKTGYTSATRWSAYTRTVAR